MSTVAEHLRSLEEALLDPRVRGDRAAVLDLLSDDFREFGSSGRIWSRDQIVEMLVSETPSLIRVEGFHCELIAENVALATSRAVRTDSGTEMSVPSLRSSIWIKEAKGWRIRFHQGTRIG